ncbi:MAG: DUF58 domain-containing protein [Bacteroidia bacterium]|jgi:uncharacterized protein (DUF58 family)|nr:DUF58 domain-containing protein [Bacteroidia bacterium]
MPIRPQDIVHTGNLELLAKKAIEGFITGFHKSPFHGFSVEFAEHRQYNPGDSTKNIDWKLYGRTDKLYNKQFDEETNLRCQFLIDISPSMQVAQKNELSKLQFAVWATAVFSQILKKQRDASGICFFDESIKDYTKIASSSRHYKELLFKLDTYLSYKTEQKTTNIADALHTIAAQIHRRSMVVLFTDFFEKGRDLEKIFDAIKHLKHNKHEVIVFHTLHHKSEISFDFMNTPMTFEDAETGNQVKLQPADVKQQYVDAVTAYTTNIKSRLNQYKIDYIEADTSDGIEKIVTSFLVKRRRMNR